MHDVLKVNVMANIHDENDISPPIPMRTHGQAYLRGQCDGGAGRRKTTALKNIRNLKGLKPYVIEGDIESISTQGISEAFGSRPIRSTPSALSSGCADGAHMTQNIRFDEKESFH